MEFKYIILLLCIVISALVSWVITSYFYRKKITALREENLHLQHQASMNENLTNEVQIAFSKIAQEAIKTQQEQLTNQNSIALQNRMDLFKAQEIAPINALLKDFKTSIDNYQKSHERETLDIKNAISTAEKYAKALTTNQNSKGEFGEKWLENILNFVGLKENIHYKKQVVSADVKPDFILFLPEDKHLVIDSKVILKNYIDYCNNDFDEDLKKQFISDLSDCVISLGKKNYEEIPETNQPGFILMFIPIESCVNLIYTDPEFSKVVELANSKNIIITGASSLIVTLRVVNNLWISKTRSDNVQNIIDVGAKLYNKIAKHAQSLLNIQQYIDKAYDSIHTEVKRFESDKGSIFRETENLRQFGIGAKNLKTGKKIVENSIPEEFLQEV